MDELRLRLCGMASRFSLNRDDAEDVAQEAMLRLCLARSNGTNIVDERAFACRTAARLAIERLRARRNHHDKLQEMARLRSTSTEPPEPPLDVQRLYGAIARLPPKQAAVITLRKLMELEYWEVAAILGTSEDSCRSLCHLAIKRLREMLTE